MKNQGNVHKSKERKCIFTSQNSSEKGRSDTVLMRVWYQKKGQNAALNSAADTDNVCSISGLFQTQSALVCASNSCPQTCAAAAPAPRQVEGSALTAPAPPQRRASPGKLGHPREGEGMEGGGVEGEGRGQGAAAIVDACL